MRCATPIGDGQGDSSSAGQVLVPARGTVCADRPAASEQKGHPGIPAKYQVQLQDPHEQGSPTSLAVMARAIDHRALFRHERICFSEMGGCSATA